VTESSPATDGPLARALALARPVVASAPAGLLTDFDGTLSPIVEDPAAARLVDGASEALERLAGRMAVVAIVTGRSPVDARRMVGVPGLLVAGNHGTEWLEPGAEVAQAVPEAAAVRDRLASLRRRVPERSGVTLEDKGLSATVHYRNAPDPEAARAAILDALGEVGPELELRPGRMSVEIRPVGLGDKGAASRRIIDRFALSGVVVMGDDVTDLDMFGAVAEEREAGRLIGAIVAVAGAGGEVPSRVAEAADVVLDGVEEAARFLEGLGSG
jgi:trehalose 6-phosphate phosphatase